MDEGREGAAKVKGRTDLTDPELQPSLDRLTRVAARLLDVPVAQINVVDPERQTTVSGAGPDRWGTRHEVPLSHSYCRYVVARNTPLLVRDAQTHELVRDSAATTASGIRGYMAVPIGLSTGEVLGTICVVDFQPRAWAETDRSALEDLATSVAAEVQLRRLQQDRLREVEERFDATLQGAGVGLAHIALDGTWLRVNERLCEIVGYSREELTQLRFADVTHPEDLVSDRRHAQSLLRGEIPRYRLEKRYVRADGRTVWTELTASLVRDPAGDPEYFMAVVQDISAAVATRKAVSDSEARFRSLFEHNPHAVFGIDLQGQFSAANAAASTLTRLSAESLRGMSYLDVVVVRDRASATETFARAARGEVSSFQYGIQRQDGERTIRGVVFPMKVDEAVVGVYGIAEDITDQLRLEEQLRQSQKMEAVGKLAGGVAHDFNNILTSIKGFTAMALEELPPHSPSREDLEEVRRSAERASELTRQLLTFSRKQVLQTEVLDPNAVLAGMEKMLRRLIEGDIVVETALGKDLPGVRMDAGQLEQVLLNLALNARDAMPGGGRLTLSTRKVESLDQAPPAGDPDVNPGPYVLVSVSDTGIGMDAETQHRIFEPFFTTKPPGHGTGLGLATVWGIVETAGGTLSVYSQPGEGTTFKIYLPAVDGVVGAAPEAPGTATTSPGNATVLVVEDENSVRKLIGRVLRNRGFEVLEAENGREALKVAREFADPIDLVLTDVVMPEMGGAELADRLRADRPELQVLFMSGYTEDEALRRGILDSPGSFVEKPFSAQSLVARVQEALIRSAPGS